MFTHSLAKLKICKILTTCTKQYLQMLIHLVKLWTTLPFVYRVHQLENCILLTKFWQYVTPCWGFPRYERGDYPLAPIWKGGTSNWKLQHVLNPLSVLVFQYGRQTSSFLSSCTGMCGAIDVVMPCGSTSIEWGSWGGACGLPCPLPTCPIDMGRSRVLVWSCWVLYGICGARSWTGGMCCIVSVGNVFGFGWSSFIWVLSSGLVDEGSMGRCDEVSK